MSKLTLTGAFAQYGAELVNPRWACSAIATGSKGEELVVCLWEQMFHPIAEGGQRYEDQFWRWDVNPHGKNLFRTHLQKAHTSRMPVRLIVACVSDRTARESIDAGEAAHELPKTFELRKNWVGEVVEFTEDKFIINFRID